MPGYEDHYFQDYALYAVTFGEYNSWDTWHLIPTGRPSIAPPAVKTNFVEVPGGNGSLSCVSINALGKRFMIRSCMLFTIKQ